LAAPIKVRGDHVIGVLGLQKEGEDVPWNPEQIALIETVAAQVAQAMEAIHLIDETQRYADRERLLAEVSDKIRSAPDMGSILRIAVQEIRRILGVSHGFIRLGTETHLRPLDTDDGVTEEETVSLELETDEGEGQDE
jgi:GAF domain-containing protein